MKNSVIFVLSLSIIFRLSGATNSDDEESCPKEGCPTEFDHDLQNFDQEDPELAKRVKENFLISPPEDKGRLLLNSTSDLWSIPKLRAQYGQPIAVQDLFYGEDGALKDVAIKDRFFVEAGAYDGAVLSNSLFLELMRKWTGLLVEPNPDAFKIMKSRGRNAWLYPGCFSTIDKPQIVQFDAAGLLGGIENTADPSKPKPGGKVIPEETSRRTIPAQCIPFYSVIQSIGNPRIDYLSLDVEGSELQILQTIPWDKVDISVLGIEINHLGEVFPGLLEDLRKFLFDRGYKIFQKVSIDEIYIKKSLLKKIKKERNI